MNETSALVLDLWDRHPVGVVSVPSRPEHSVDLGGFSTGKGHLRPFGPDVTAHHDHPLFSQPAQFQRLARKGISLHKVASDRAFARCPQDAQPIHPPEDALPQYSVRAYPSVMSGSEKNLVSSGQLQGDFSPGCAVSHYQHPPGSKLVWGP